MRCKNHLNENLKKEFLFIINNKVTDDSMVKCTIFNREFSIEIGWQSLIIKHH